MIKKILLAFSIAFIAPMVMMAGTVTPEQARQRARQFLSEKPTPAVAASRQAGRSLRMVSQTDEQPAYYVFNVGQGQGFVLVSADERTPSILGYADSGSFDADRMPDNMKSWLQGYADQIGWLRAHEDTIPAAQDFDPSEPIGPLLTTQWNQDAPFNDQCPLFVNNQPSVTGCVATAMAQVLKYLNQTTGKPTGTIMDIDGYDCPSRWNQGQVHVDAKPMTDFDFDKMLEYYSGSESAEEKEAVAKLMAYCGAAVGMDYRDDMNGGSGAQTAAVPNALRTYFGVQANFAIRDSYGYRQWTELIGKELSEGRPVMLGGQSSGGGHTFIIDGYDGYGLFHVNWGWGGLSDGYFVLSVMNPNNNSGIGASTSDDGYSFAQELVYGLGDETAGQVGAQLSFSDFTFSGDVLGFVAYNYTGATNNFDFGIGQIDDEGQISCPMVVQTNRMMQHSTGVKLSNYRINRDALGLTAPGTYKLVGISRVTGTEAWLTRMNPERNYIEAVVGEDMTIGFTIMPLPGVLHVADISLKGNKLAGQDQTLSVTIQNEGEEFYGRLFLFASQNPDNKGKSLGWSGVTIERDATTTIEFTFTPTASGKWHLWLATDEAGSDVIANHEVDISADPYSHDGKFMISQLTVDEASDDWNIDEQGNRLIYVLSDDETQTLTFNPTVKNVSGANLAGSIELNFSLEKQGSDGVWRSMPRSYNTSFTSFSANHTVSYTGMTYETSGYGTYRLVLKMNGSIQDTHYNIVLAKGIADLWDGQGVKRVVPVLASTFRPDAEATAVDLSRLDLSVVSVSPTANPNTVYMIADEQEVPAALVASNVVKGGKAETIVLKDGYDFYTPVSFTVGHVSYERTFETAYSPENNGWSTIMLPFTVDSIAVDGTPADWPRSADDEAADVYLMAFSGDAPETLYFDYAPAFEAYQPYIISLCASEHVGRPVEFMADDAVVAAGHPGVVARDHHQFHGTLATTLPATVYRLNGDGNRFLNTEDTQEQPFRAYFTSDTEAPSLAVSAFGVQPDAIQTPLRGQAGAATGVYSLSGLRLADDLTRLPAGVYVVGGKILVKTKK